MLREINGILRQTNLPNESEEYLLKREELRRAEIDLRNQRKIGSGNNSQIQILSQMMSDAIEAVNPCRAHRARLCLFFAEHEVIDDKRPIRTCEKFAETYVSDWPVSCIKLRRNLLEDIVFDGRTFGEPPA